MERTIAGVKIPDSKMTRDLTQLIRDTESDLLFHHSNSRLSVRRSIGPAEETEV